MVNQKRKEDNTIRKIKESTICKKLNLFFFSIFFSGVRLILLFINNDCYKPILERAGKKEMMEYDWMWTVVINVCAIEIA